MSEIPPASAETPAPVVVDGHNVGDSVAPTATKKKRPVFVPPKVQKQLDALKSKQDKLVADNKALKKQLAELKSSHSRIRRIPKAPVPAPPASE